MGQQRQIEEVVPWGRNFQEYVRMFNLDEENLPNSILDCAGGPSSFCAEATKRGSIVVSVDPIYEFSPVEIEERINQVTPKVRRLMQDNSEKYLFDRFETPEEVITARHEAMDKFLEDYDMRQSSTRYRQGSIIDLGFLEKTFEVALSSHFLFLYDEEFTQEFHVKAIKEVLSVSQEFRIFPVTNLVGEKSRLLDPVLKELSEVNIGYEVKKVTYEFQEGSNELLVLRK